MSLIRWPRRTSTQLILLVTLALFAAQVITLWLLADEGRGALREASLRHVLQRIGYAHALLRETQPAQHPMILKALSNPLLGIDIDPTPLLGDDENPRLSRWLAEQLGVPAQAVRSRLMLQDRHCEAPPPPRPAFDSARDASPERRRLERIEHHWRRQQDAGECPPILQASLALADGRWMNAAALPPRPGFDWLRTSLISLGITLILVVLALVLGVRRLTAPLRELSLAAARFSRGETLPVDERGPEDVRQVIRAFNAMQERVSRAVEDRARLLAALSHDLRTPITSMRLRVEMMPSSEDRSRLLESLAEMQTLAEATLDFVRGASAEAPRAVDLDSLLDSLCTDLSDLGQPVHYTRAGRCLLSTRPNALRRALANLIDNGVKYGQRVDVSLEHQAQNLLIRIRDYGSGIPDADQERVFEPFCRLEDSRNRETGGTGLGLAIARALIRQHGGEIRLRNRPDGLDVEVELPPGW